MSESDLKRRLLQGLAASALIFGAPLVRAAQDKTLRIDHQKFNTLNIFKGTGQLEKTLQIPRTGPCFMALSFYVRALKSLDFRSNNGNPQTYLLKLLPRAILIPRQC